MWKASKAELDAVLRKITLFEIKFRDASKTRKASICKGSLLYGK